MTGDLESSEFFTANDNSYVLISDEEKTENRRLSTESLTILEEPKLDQFLLNLSPVKNESQKNDYEESLFTKQHASEDEHTEIKQKLNEEKVVEEVNNVFDYRNEILSQSSSNISYSQSDHVLSQTVDEESNYELLRERLQLPLSEAIRPTNLQEYIGQSHLMGEEVGSIKQFFRLGYIPSMILHGPPGVGKTTIASILAKETGYVFIELSATEATIPDIRDLLNLVKKENKSREFREEDCLKIVVFIDEIHRFSKIQQDYLLPFVEAGDFVFIGATTFNPKSRIRRALLSRCQLYELTNLSTDETEQVLKRAILYENIRRRINHGMKFLQYDSKCIQHIIKRCYGDTRQAINLVELISTHFMSEEYKYNVNDKPFELEFDDLESTIRVLRLNESGLQDQKNIELFLELYKYLHNPKYDLKDEDSSNNSKPIEELWPVQKDKNNDLFKEHTNYQPVAIDRSTEGQFIVKLRLKVKQNHDDYPSFLEYFKTRRFDDDYDDKESKYLKQMQFSDEENEEEDIDIFNEGNNETYDLENISSDDYNVLAAIFCILKLINQGESYMFIIKQLILFAILYLDTGMLEPTKTLSCAKSIEKSGTDVLEVITNCVERLTKSEKTKITAYNDPIRHLELLKEYWRYCGFNTKSQREIKFKMPLFEVKYVPESEYEAMLSEGMAKRENKKEFPNIDIQNIEEVDLSYLDDLELSVLLGSLSDEAENYD